MRDLIEDLVFIIIVAVVFVMLCIFGTEYSKQLDKEESQKATYTECIKTDYDKFQCYSMIYGDK